MVKVVSKRSNRELGEIDLKTATTVNELKKQWQSKSKLAVARHRFEYNGVVLEDGKSLADYNIKDGDSLLFRDLGPQVGWTTVYVVEYAGPLILYALLSLRPSFIYNSSDVSKHPLGYVQLISLACWSFHFIKRILETLFVHKFSKGTMPLSFLFRNSAYYWSMGVLVGYFHNHPLYTPPNNVIQLYLGLALFLLSEVGNFVCHLILSNLRPAGTRVRGIPRGFLFEYCSCPNYFLEVTAWLSFSLMTSSLPGLIFAAIGGMTMFNWAVVRHVKYIKEFDGKEGREKYPRRKIFVPFLL
eukprot:TRINITY_DN2115_c0_g2_i1.p1 TRINITY_DN2115_c0_g2~~TRINITY_DN2115_c0_g2_i1.p1  ORF type:complete len:328 (-),score=78.85 TRINITY_DN2115_c0_g2_i1:92-988(-)